MTVKNTHMAVADVLKLCHDLQSEKEGVEPERQGKIEVSVGEDYAQRALAYFVVQYPDQAGASR